MNTCSRCGYDGGPMRQIWGTYGPDLGKAVCKDEQACAVRVAAKQGSTLWDAFAKAKGWR